MGAHQTEVQDSHIEGDYYTAHLEIKKANNSLPAKKPTR